MWKFLEGPDFGDKASVSFKVQKMNQVQVRMSKLKIAAVNINNLNLPGMFVQNNVSNHAKGKTRETTERLSRGPRETSLYP